MAARQLLDDSQIKEKIAAMMVMAAFTSSCRQIETPDAAKPTWLRRILIKKTLTAREAERIIRKCISLQMQRQQASKQTITLV